MGGEKNADRYRGKEDRERRKQPGRIRQCHICVEVAREWNQAYEAEGWTDVCLVDRRYCQHHTE